jgi:hypothetical protein
MRLLLLVNIYLLLLINIYLLLLFKVHLLPSPLQWGLGLGRMHKLQVYIHALITFIPSLLQSTNFAPPSPMLTYGCFSRCSSYS